MCLQTLRPARLYSGFTGLLGTVQDEVEFANILIIKKTIGPSKVRVLFVGRIIKPHYFPMRERSNK